MFREWTPKVSPLLIAPTAPDTPLSDRAKECT